MLLFIGWKPSCGRRFYGAIGRLAQAVRPPLPQLGDVRSIAQGVNISTVPRINGGAPGCSISTPVFLKATFTRLSVSAFFSATLPHACHLSSRYDRLILLIAPKLRALGLGSLGPEAAMATPTRKSIRVLLGFGISAPMNAPKRVDHKVFKLAASTQPRHSPQRSWDSSTVFL
jgi:hypothetical protein